MKMNMGTPMMPMDEHDPRYTHEQDYMMSGSRPRIYPGMDHSIIYPKTDEYDPKQTGIVIRQPL